MWNFNSIKNFNLENKDDKYNFFKVLDNNLKIWKQLIDIFSSKLANFEITNMWEFATEIDINNTKIDQQILKKFFILNWNKLWSRWIWYYWLFWEIYKEKNRKLKNNLENWWNMLNSFWEEYDEYIKLLTNMKNEKQFIIHYLDNYRNFVLLWSYILIILDKSSCKFNPIKSFKIKINDREKKEINNLVKDLINKYELILENIINFIFSKQNKLDNNLYDLEIYYNKLKELFFRKNLISTKKSKYSLNEFFSKNVSTLKIWFDSIFRNIREEDNLWVTFSIFLKNKIINNNIKSLSDLKKIIDLEKKNNKWQIFILSNLYWWIEFALVWKYLGYDTWWINYSVYHLKQNNTYISINDLIYSLKWNLNWKEIILMDDNINSWKTLEKTANILNNNGIPVKLKIAVRIELEKNDREILKNLDKEKNNLILKNYSNNFPEIKKHVVLNSIFLLPRTWCLIKRKNLKLKKLYWKGFRSL